MKKKNIINIIVVICLVIYVLFSTDAVDEIKNNTANVANINLEEKTSIKEVDGNLYVYFIDVGQADSILIKTDDTNMLIDAGNNEDGKLLVSYLKSLNIEKLDYVIGTHPHEDHIGGMDDIINSFKIDKYIMPDVLTTTKTFEDVLDALDKNNLSYTVPKENDVYNLGEAEIKIVHVGDSDSSLNDSSIVLKLTYGNNSFLFTGDATSNVEKNILSSNINISSDVLKVAHHGSSYSTTDDFISIVNPKYAVISVGKNNSYNHPSLNTLEKLENKKIKVYRTDISGTIIFTSNGNDITVETTYTNTNG